VSKEYSKLVSMEHIVKRVSSGLLIGLLTVLSVGSHVGAQAPQTTHAMGGMSHSAGSSFSCITACTSAKFHKTEYINETNENDDDELQTPFYVQLLASPLAICKNEHSQEAHLAIEREPPPGGLPAYVALNVFRA